MISECKNSINIFLPCYPTAAQLILHFLLSVLAVLGLIATNSHLMMIIIFENLITLHATRALILLA